MGRPVEVLTERALQFANSAVDRLKYWRAKSNRYFDPAERSGFSFMGASRQAAPFALLVSAAVLVDVYVPYPAAWFEWAGRWGVGLKVAPEVIVGDSAKYLLTIMPFLTTLTTFVFTGTREFSLSLRFFENPRLSSLIRWFVVTVLYGLVLSNFLKPVATHDWLFSIYVFGACYVRTVYLAFRFLQQQFRRATLNGEIKEALQQVSIWTELLKRPDLSTEPITKYIDTHIEVAFQVLNTFLRLKMDVLYEDFRRKLEAPVGAYLLAPLREERTEFARRVHFLMKKYADHMSLQADRHLFPELSDTTEMAFGHLDAAVAKDPLVFAWGLAGIKGLARSQTKNRENLKMLLDRLVKSKGTATRLGQVALVRFYQFLLLEAAVSDDRITLNELLYKVRDLAERQEMDDEVRNYLYTVLIGVGVKTVEHSAQTSCGTFLKTFVSNFHPDLGQKAIERLLTEWVRHKGRMNPLEFSFAPSDFPDGATDVQYQEKLDAIAPPIEFIQRTVEYCFLKFILLWYAQQKYVVSKKANFHQALQSARFPKLAVTAFGDLHYLDYVVSKLEDGKYPLSFLKDKDFMRDLRRDVDWRWGISS